MEPHTASQKTISKNCKKQSIPNTKRRTRHFSTSNNDYFIRSLSAPMVLSRTGELCSRMQITPGETLTIGRSKHSCDIVFEDPRVSRKHCQLQLLPNDNSLLLVNGSASSVSSENQHLKNWNEGPSQNSLVDRDMLWKPSLNGIFVNGQAFSDRILRLMPGDEVSLVSPSKKGFGSDSSCTLAVGFVVEEEVVERFHKTARVSSEIHAVSDYDRKSKNSQSHISGQRTVLNCNSVLANDNASDNRTHITWTDLDDHRSSVLMETNISTSNSTDRKQMNAVMMNPQSPSKPGIQNPVSVHTSQKDIQCGQMNNIDIADSLQRGAKSKEHLPEKTHSFMDSDTRYVSVLNLVKKSMQLRFSVLAGYDNPPVEDTKVYKFVTSQETETITDLAIRDAVSIIQGNLLKQATPNEESTQFNNLPEVCEAITAMDKKEAEAMTNLNDTYGPIKKNNEIKYRENVSLLTENLSISQNCNNKQNRNVSLINKCSRYSSVSLQHSAESISEESGNILPYTCSETEKVYKRKRAESKAPEKQMNESMIFGLSKENGTGGQKIICVIAESDAQKVDSDTQVLRSYTSETSTANLHIIDVDESYCKVSLDEGMVEHNKFCTQKLPSTSIDICQITIENQTLPPHVAVSSKQVNEEDQSMALYASAVETKKTFTKAFPSTFIDIGQIIIEDQIMVDHKVNTLKSHTQVPEDDAVIKYPTLPASVINTDINIETKDGQGRHDLKPHHWTCFSDEDAKCGYNVKETILCQSNSQKVEFQEEYLPGVPEDFPSKNAEESKYQEIRTNSNPAEDDRNMPTHSKAEDVRGEQNLTHLSALDAMSCHKVEEKPLFASDSQKANIPNENDEASDTREIANNRSSATLLGSFELKNTGEGETIHAFEVPPAEETNCVSQHLFSSHLELCEEESLLEETVSHKDDSIVCFLSNILEPSIPKDADPIKSDDVSVNKVSSTTILHKYQDQDGECFMVDAVDKQLNIKDVILEEYNYKSPCANNLVEFEDRKLTKMDKRTPDTCEQKSAISLQDKRTHLPGYYLNHLEDVSDKKYAISLQDLLAPICDIQALFIATFTYDVEWFLSFCGIPTHIPVTVACHDSKKCWSSSVKDRCEKSNEEWPNLTLVYPPFPKSSSIGKGKGIGCHHPKLFLVYRADSIRVVVSSANLNFRQWFHVSNNVWWQDFPRRQSPDLRSLFHQEQGRGIVTTGDFASQLAHFLAALLTDAPSEAHWITDLAAYDFTLAMGSLVASVPGIHYPLYHNAPNFLMTLEKESYSLTQYEDDYGSKHLGVVTTTVAGIKYRFSPTADKKGIRIRALAAILKNANGDSGSTMPVLLKRAKFLKADPNAVSVVVTSQALECSQDLFLQEDLHNAEINTMEADIVPEQNTFVKLGFLPKDVANWLSVLCDRGFFSFAACIWTNEALAVASGQSDESVKLALYVFEGPKFAELANMLLNEEEHAAFAGLLKSLHNTWGIWRLEKVLSKYKWNDAHESDFLVASSSIGTSLDAQFLAAFAAAAGRRSDSCASSQDSDPEWGCWTAEQESIRPSIGIVFPCIERVKRGDLSHYGLLCFSESAWLRLKPARLLHDAVPNPPERDSFPMHIKIARRRFQQSSSSRPYGWLYCGSHNFSPAAWGRPLWRAADYGCVTGAAVLGTSLQISNYELGIVFVEPPNEIIYEDNYLLDSQGIDKFLLPFQTPPPAYTDEDRPATGKAMNEAFLELRELQQKAAEEALIIMESEVPVEDEANNVQQESAYKAKDEEEKAEEAYVVALWSQIDDPNA